MEATDWSTAQQEGDWNGLIRAWKLHGSSMPCPCMICIHGWGELMVIGVNEHDDCIE